MLQSLRDSSMKTNITNSTSCIVEINVTKSNVFSAGYIYNGLLQSYVGLLESNIHFNILSVR